MNEQSVRDAFSDEEYQAIVVNSTADAIMAHGVKRFRDFSTQRVPATDPHDDVLSIVQDTMVYEVSGGWEGGLTEEQENFLEAITVDVIERINVIGTDFEEGDRFRIDEDAER